MKPEMQAMLKDSGMDVEETLARFGGNEALLLKYLRRFPTDPSFGELETALHGCDCEASKAACHALKGISGTLGLQPLYLASSELMADLRTGNGAAPSPARIAAVRASYGQALAAIAALGD